MLSPSRICLKSNTQLRRNPHPERLAGEGSGPILRRRAEAVIVEWRARAGDSAAPAAASHGREAYRNRGRRGVETCRQSVRHMRRRTAGAHGLERSLGSVRLSMACEAPRPPRWPSCGSSALAVARSGWDHRLVSPAGSGKAQFRGGLAAHVGRHPARSTWQWLVLAWLFGLGLVVVSGLFPSAVGYVVILSACLVLGSVLGAPGDPSGLRDHRQ
jgi:hypothetical protein